MDRLTRACRADESHQYRPESTVDEMNFENYRIVYMFATLSYCFTFIKRIYYFFETACLTHEDPHMPNGRKR